LADAAASWLTTVQQIVEAIADSDLVEFELSQPGFRLALRRRPAPRPGPAASPERPAPDGHQVAAPFTGIFYRAASPNAGPYVREGDLVEVGAVVGLIETMKIFNEVRTEQAGLIASVLVENGQLVQAGEPLVIVTPAPRPADEPPL
jgi:acetyl-CoA carboxylase biotin carboxyl carrier protein